MASQFALLLGLLAITCSVAFASDNNPLQDFCVADNSSSEDCVSIIGAHLTASSEAPVAKLAGIPVRTRLPITTHVLDVARRSPASGIDVQLEMWRGNQACPTFAPWIAKRRGGDGRTGGCVADSITLQLRIHVPNSGIPTESTKDRGAGLGIISGVGDSRGG
ncbi:Uric acid degradation bifunctional protein TTL [Camellia lanceoleosa]|uniref:Uric acid degradation bifunctional protein TTL n=1 Tax=Camellia lanceoleosa TaxID=1840588 RepID=A0ACC0I580_9ERIC|nr:Uric acid degradation bifunctional protein TTL [Camellia lanceoleosa]